VSLLLERHKVRLLCCTVGFRVAMQCLKRLGRVVNVVCGDGAPGVVLVHHKLQAAPVPGSKQHSWQEWAAHGSIPGHTIMVLATMIGFQVARCSPGNTAGFHTFTCALTQPLCIVLQLCALMLTQQKLVMPAAKQCWPLMRAKALRETTSS
jgi:hypothetical protein